MKDNLNKFKILLLDADGTFYDGTEVRFKTKDGYRVAKTRWFPDGQGLSFIRAMGITILFVSGEGEPLDSHVEKFNNLPSCKSGEWTEIEVYQKVSGQGKVEAIGSWLESKGFSWGDCVYMGDDVNDHQAMKKVRDSGGIVFAPSNVQEEIKDVVDHVLTSPGGKGAIRELARIILKERGIDPLSLPFK